MNNTKTTYKYLTLLAMAYMTLKLVTILLIYKVIKIGSISFTASTVVIPFWFFLGTIIAEGYGYVVARHVIWMAIIFQFIFALICTSLTYVHSPDWVNQAAYEYIFGKLPRVTIASFIAILCGAFINAYSLAKYKILSKGKRFWLRSLKSSVIGELVFTVIAYLSEFIGMIPFQQIIYLMMISFLVKVTFSALLVVPSILATKMLKKAEGINVFDYNTNFNPFKFSLNEKNNNTHECEMTNVLPFSTRTQSIQ
ncbi:MAG: queuosine precursor transporter [Legionella sp.]|uniref:queuosine precursor transporter n=1 Tax=Legionella sp. TaxID=459 RepID=UPI003D0EBBF9